MSYPPQPGQYGPQQGWGPQQPPQDGSQDFWRQVAGGTGGPQPPYPPQPPKKSNTGLIIGLAAGGAALVLVVVVILVFALNGGRDDNQAGGETGGGTSPTTSKTRPTTTSSETGSGIEVGDCVALSVQSGGSLTEEPCGSADSDYEIVEVKSGEDKNGCPDNYSNTYSGDTYCMVLDVVVGDCLTGYSEDDSVLPLKEECASPAAVDQVTKVDTNPTAEQVCKPEEGWYSFQDPPFTACFADKKPA
ncbi:hypothetical protein A8924_0949 [Saccharopolyspora erythraea NRRL 2338]|uniref:Uncharacterized protein n=2 Tax=Saccharopolyspora erythraea TaxID=1836 RepID=A4F771_SACEN|nr:hypothetical protein [Saccharopolyspora erythraea]EQD86384.1 hypothetical protein N599_10100 [Saccharopolyspora erythraea D]PFG93698.1 hypothetical protein A8924_0949 [Saccharopolyspora erythraea NRRL 2338]QRK90542.1 hypothetical protein JQX30_03295 [Saccharopolyspora erythraea]CAL99895.1 hypothetical protein SACE_0549 [Saccharopolyspora erythraea NRRL 2338]